MSVTTTEEDSDQESQAEEIEEGDRVSVLKDGEPTRILGEVVSTDSSILEEADHDAIAIKIQSDVPNKGRVKVLANNEVQKIGCDYCAHTGVTAEIREGTRYPTACAKCFQEGKQLGYLWGATKYKITHEE